MLKNFAICLIFSLATLAGNSQGKADSVNATLKFEELSHDFGKIKNGRTEKYDFVFTNTGKQPVVLTSVKKPCVCTKVKWSKKPVKSGGQGVITVSYNAKDKGTFYQTVEVGSSVADEKTTLIIKGSVY